MSPNATRPPGRPEGIRDTSQVEEVFFASPFRMIVPWEWNWFDDTKATS